MSSPLPIYYFSDVCCVFAYAASARIEQLQADFGDQIDLRQHFISIYGDVPRRIERKFKSTEHYNKNTLKNAARFDHVEVNPAVFLDGYPVSSAPAHLYLRAVKLLQDKEVISPVFSSLIWDFRVAFFRDLIDISKRENLDEIADRHGVPIDAVGQLIDDGSAFAELDNDVFLQRKFDAKVSPTLVLNEGRQHLNGNVGYRLIEANVREVLKKPDSEMSWC